ncbi:MAG: glycosyltransferase family 4 protein [Hyphomonadaceae bacterium]|nr:glycosyltransferase family 4 protein [Clostridia bacterium]
MQQTKIFICGNFGYKNNQLDGQTIKTRTLKDELVKRALNAQIVYTDTSYIKAKPFQVFKEIYTHFKSCSHLIMMPDKNALKVLLPLYMLWNYKQKRDIRYVVIGGWLPNFLKGNQFYKNLTAKIDGVYVEANEMKVNLEKIGLINATILPNFRDFDFKPMVHKKVTIPLKLVFFSRVFKEKGIEIAVGAVNHINRNHNEQVVTLDIYGPIQERYKQDFFEIINRQEDSIKYNGILQPSEIHESLSVYDAMIFPTYYESEGFPGVVIDAFIAGLPIIASHWKYNAEFIKEDVHGKLFRANDEKDLQEKIVYFINNPNQIDEMRANCIVQARHYHVENVMENLISDMKLSI